MDAVCGKWPVRRVFPGGPAHHKGVHAGCSAQTDMDVERTGTAVPLATMDFVVADFAIKMDFDARPNGGSVGGGALESEADVVPACVEVFQDLETRLGGRAAGGDGEVPIPVTVQIPRCQPVIAVVVFQDHIPFADPSERGIAEAPVQAVRRRREGIVIDDVQVRFGVVVVVEKDAAPGHA